MLHYSTDKEKTQARTRQAAQEISDQNTSVIAAKEHLTPEGRLDFLHGVEIARKSFLNILLLDEDWGRPVLLMFVSCLYSLFPFLQIQYASQPVKNKPIVWRTRYVF